MHDAMHDVARGPSVPCHRCGYDVRAQPVDGICPECAASVAESRVLARVPRRPLWRDSDPRWRRRMVAGMWMLVLVPLLPVMNQLGWSDRVPAPTFLDAQAGQSMAETFASMTWAHLTFTVGAVLLFARERERQRGRLDWARRWGVIGSYLVALLGIVQYAFITALVTCGIAYLVLSIRRSVQPIDPTWFVQLGTWYVWYGPQPGRLADAALAACSSAVVLLACAPLFDALRCGASRVWAAVLLAPLALGALVRLGHAGLYAIDPLLISGVVAPVPPFYFQPELLAEGLAKLNWPYLNRDFLAEATKWAACLAIAVWLSVAQLAAIGRRRTGSRGRMPA